MNTHDDIPLFALPSSPTLADLDEIFEFLYDKVSNIYLQVNSPIIVRYQRRLVQASKYPLESTSVELLMSSNALAQVKKGIPQSFTHKTRIKVKKDGVDQLRFRCNAKSVHTLFEAETFAVNMRPSEPVPRDIRTLNLPEGLIASLFPENGIVLFSGPTGAGKTTTMAAVMRELCYDKDGKVIVTVEDPVERMLHALETTTAAITHCEVGRNVETFPLAMRAALREDPDVIMTGEMRDVETMMIGIEAALTGHAVYSTIHCNSVSNILVRVAQKLSSEMSAEAVSTCIASFIETGRTFVYQRLIKGVAGDSVPIIEYVSMDPQARVDLSEAFGRGGIGEATRMLDTILGRSGRRFVDAATEVFKAGRIDEEQYTKITAEYEVNSRVERGGIQ